LPTEAKPRTHPAQYTRLVEPHPAMPIILLPSAQFRFVDQGKPAATCSLHGAGIEVDRRRAAVELLGGDGRGGLENRAFLVVDHPSRVAPGDELQPLYPGPSRSRLHPGHPVLLMAPL